MKGKGKIMTYWLMDESEPESEKRCLLSRPASTLYKDPVPRVDLITVKNSQEECIINSTESVNVKHDSGTLEATISNRTKRVRINHQFQFSY